MFFSMISGVFSNFAYVSNKEKAPRVESRLSHHRGLGQEETGGCAGQFLVGEVFSGQREAG